MDGIKEARICAKLSQRRLAELAGISYKSLQLIEGGRHNPELASLEKIAVALGYPKKLYQDYATDFFNAPPDSIVVLSKRLALLGGKEWKIHFMNFVDAFRASGNELFIEEPPTSKLDPKLRALLTGGVETLCDEKAIGAPSWCQGIDSLQRPWFVAGVENLKTMALLESPMHFRKRNIFVLGNFLQRA